jgi:Raf kinase inhibitor-like YbhB/YbcL family protein
MPHKAAEGRRSPKPGGISLALYSLECASPLALSNPGAKGEYSRSFKPQWQRSVTSADCEASFFELRFRMILEFQRNSLTLIKRKLLFVPAICLAIACVPVATGTILQPPETHTLMEITSSAFKNGQPIPSQYTCDDKNISPPLAWNGAPANAQSLALIVDDPDAPTGVWTHWVVFDLPADASGLPEDAAKNESVIGKAKQGLNDFKNAGYGGPCPPGGKSHRYFFKIYALDITLGLPSGAPRKAVEAAMTKHILAQGQWMGTYQRK